MSENSPSPVGEGARGGTEALGGPLAARAIADGAELLAIVAAGSSEGWAEAGGAAAQAGKLRRRALELGGVDVEAHAQASEALRSRAAQDGEPRDWQIGEAVAGAAVPPLKLVEVAADLADLAAAVAERCDPELRPDAVCACLLAEGAGQAAAHLLEVNLTVTQEDPRLAASGRCVEAMQRAVDRSLDGS